MKIKVTKQCIKNAVRKDSHHCMIADAIHTADPKAKYVLVDLQSIRWSNIEKGERYTALTPTKAQEMLLAWDAGKPVDPFMFTVHPQITKPVGWKARHPNSSRKGKKYRRTGRHNAPHVVREREFGVRLFAKSK